MKITAQALSQLLQVPLVGDANPEVQRVFFDSRKIIQGAQAVFFALSGSQKDGHDFVLDAHKKGVRCFVVTREIPELSEAAQIIHPDPLRALQFWAKTHRTRFRLPVIGITGSNGKTVVKEWLHSLLHERFNIVRSPKSYNSQIGVALSLLQLDSRHDLALVEAGISTTHEMALLQDMIRPNIGLLTNIGSAHAQGFGSRTEHINEKLKLFEKADKLICFSGDEAVFEAIQNQFDPKRIFSIGKNPSDDLQILEIKTRGGKSHLKLHWLKEEHELIIPFRDKASIQNGLSCLAACIVLDVSFTEIQAQFQRLETVSMRLEFIEGINGNRIISDVFNSDLQSLEIALESLSEQSNPTKILILSDILQSHLSHSELYQKVAQVVNRHALQEVLLVGNSLPQFASLFLAKTRVFYSTQALLNQFDTTKLHKVDVLVKGARPFAFEQIVQKLERQNHETVLEVKQDALVHNLNYFRAQLSPKTKLMIMVKALSYGTGNIEIAEILERQKIDYLGVAYADEGIALRKAGISLPIMVLNPEMRSHSAMLDFGLEPEVYNLRMAEHLFGEWRKNQSDGRLKIHIKINTGMNRLGFAPNDLAEFLTHFHQQNDIEIASVFTHLATADTDAAFAKKQISLFDEAYDSICERLSYKPMRHILNSAGIVEHPQFQYEMVRLGIGLYGFSHDPKTQQHLQNVVHFHTIISQINHLQEGDAVGYGRGFFAKGATRIATLPVGYADGVPRSMGNGKAYVRIHGKKAPIVGHICMDMLMVDVTNIRCKEGDAVLLFGDSPSILDWARWQNTISYEVLTGISSRVKRVYTQS